eukprot:5968609-Pyramimonas_sp.AAC.1
MYVYITTCAHWGQQTQSSRRPSCRASACGKLAARATGAAATATPRANPCRSCRPAWPAGWLRRRTC